MNRLNRALFRAFLWSFITYGLCGCVHKEQHQLDVVQAEHDQLAATEHLHVDAEQRADIDQHTLETDAPTETADYDFAPMPDGGGIYLAHEHVVRTGPRQIEAWQLAQIGADEHIDYDAGTVQTRDGENRLHEDGQSDTHASAGCAFTGGLWLALAGVGVLGLVWSRRAFLWGVCKRLAGIP